MLVRKERGGSRKLLLTGFGVFFVNRGMPLVIDLLFPPHPDFQTLFYLSCTGGTNCINRLVLIYFQVCFSVISLSILMSNADPL